MVEIAPSSVRTENPRPPERLLSHTPLLGLQGRLAVGGNALFPLVTTELTQGVDSQNEPATVALLNKASTKERGAYWANQPEQSKDAQLSRWKKSVTAKMNLIPQSSIGVNHAEFFTNLHIDVAHFTEDNAQELYDAYFSKEHAGQGVSLFVSDAVKAFTHDGKIDAEALRSHLAALQWMAGMFGGNSAEIVTQLIDTEIESKADEVAFVSARKDKVNDLTNHEKELLTFLTEGQTAPVEPPKTHIDPPGKKELNPIPAGGNNPEEGFFCLLANKKTIQEVDMDTLIREYHDNPIAQIKKMQELTATTVLRMKKEGKTESEIKEYINAFLHTQIFLDNRAFPPDDIVQRGVPTYIPDGLSDMGSDSEIDDAKRTREKIRMDKEKTFANSTDLLYQIFTTEFSKTASEKDKQLYLTRLISAYVHNKIKYDYQDQLNRIYGIGGRSINIADVEALKLGVCRHHALDTQVLLQSLGIDSRLMKSSFENLGAHANNLVHIENKWYLLDTTNPEFSLDATHSPVPYLKEIPEGSIDLNAQIYTWELDKVEADGTKKKRKYVSRNNMFYRIRDNQLNPAPSHYKK